MEKITKSKDNFRFLTKIFLILFFIGASFYIYSNFSLAEWVEQTDSGERTWNDIASSSDGEKLISVAGPLEDIYISGDSGESWIGYPVGIFEPWRAVASSSDGVNLVAVPQGGRIYTSTDSGLNWVQQMTSPFGAWIDVASSSDGVNLVAVTSAGTNIYTSSDSGVNWTEQTDSGERDWQSVTSSVDGTKLAATVNAGYIYTSTNSGVDWTEQTDSGQRDWRSITSSSDGTKLTAVTSGGYIYTSSDSGVNWTEQTDSGERDWRGVASSSDGTKLVAVVSSGYIYTSNDSGVNWTEQTDSGSRPWRGITSSADGRKLAAITSGGYVYTFEDADPIISSLNPADDAVNVPISADLVITFSEEVVVHDDFAPAFINIYRSVDDSLFEFFEDGSILVGGAGTNTITITTTTDFEPNTGYYVEIDSTFFKDIPNGNFFAGISDSTTWNFTTAENLEIVSLSPADDSSNILITSNLEIQFNQTVNAEEGNFTIYKESDDSIFEQFTHGGNDATDTFIISPTNNFAPNTQYYVLISENWVDSNGGLFSGISDKTVWNFKTKSSGSTVSGSGGGGNPPLPPPPAETCATNPALCPPPTGPTPPPAPPETCATNPSLCSPPPPQTCATNPALCPPPPPIEPVETCETNPSLCPPEDPCVLNPSLCAPPPPIESTEPISPDPIEIDCTGIIDATLCIVRDSFEEVSDIFLGTFSEVKRIVNSPYGNVITKSIGVVSLTFGAIFTVLPMLFINPLSFSEIALLPMRLWSLLLTAFGIRKKTRKWGVVYDSVTKQPLDPVYVSLLDTEGKEITSSITDIDGRYGFLVEPGKYRLLPKKTDYSFPSLKAVGKSRDEIYLDLYFGYVFEITHAGEVISKNIPMDPMSFNWNEFAKDEQKLTKFYSKRDLAFNKIADIAFSVGFSVSFVALVSAATKFNIIIFSLYILLLIVRELGVRQKKSSRVIRRGTDIPLAFAIVRIFEAKTKTEILHKITDKIGKFFALVRNGEYYLTIEAKKPDESYEKVFESEVFEVKEGIIDKNFEI